MVVKPEDVISGNIKSKRKGDSIHAYLTYAQIEKLTRICEEEGIHRNKYVSEALDHYWKCKNIE